MAWDAVWEDIFRTGTWGRYPSEDLIRFVARAYYSAPQRAEVRVLELGCGPGPNLWFLAREGFSVFGIDGSASAVEAARARLDHECPGWQGELVVGDFADLPFDDAMFDAVIDHEAVYCNDFDTSIGVYEAAHRVLKPAGRLFVRTFAQGSWGDGTGEAAGYHAWRPAEGPMGGKGFSRFSTRDDLERLLSGFRLDSVERISRTAEAGSQQVTEWIVEATKVAAAG